MMNLKQILREKKWRDILFLLLVGCTAVVCFFPAAGYEFTNWDDNYLVTKNAAIRDVSLSGIVHIWTSFSLNHYHPLVTLSYAIEYYFFGLNPAVFHLSNIILHVLNSLLVVLLARFFLKRYAAAIAAGIIFALHPLRVESVVWIAERKDVLSAFFIFLALLFYMTYRTTEKQKYFYAATGWFLCALLSKAMAVTLPVLFLLCDYFIDRSIVRIRIREKIPLFLLSLAFGIIAIAGQYGGGIGPKDPAFNLWKGGFLVPYEILFYCGKFIFPFHLSPVYPYPETIGLAYPIVFWFSPMILLSLAYGYYRYFKMNRVMIFAAAFFIAAILPVLQFIPVGRLMAADRFTYVPLFGLILIAGYGMDVLWMKWSIRSVHIILGCGCFCAACVMFLLSRQQMSYWESNKTLWNRVIQDNPAYAEGYNNLGILFAEAKDYQKAFMQFNHAIILDSTDAEFYYNRGLLFLQTEQWISAAHDFSQYIELNPGDIIGYAMRANAYLHGKLFREAIADYSYVLQQRPMASSFRIERIQALAGNGEYRSALDDIQFLELTGIHLDSSYVKNIRSLADAKISR